ncbi:SpaH/EbpB family LPXTG-anchored major pilin [Rarobacter incanus]|uniref:LPXTG-motif cell wall-anchored protein/fimbrial isopeptide formation D2 family protein n=1 Tax=Rarobacter incanus TaxID=153494 RepID=A0A542SMK3_9MICO|nr:SpaH/EbpB family LPXTG-anchored major pilin [Rarobacter incanus]TQK75860.1 LPXTG-motif cell wall-anchored protein/fimbrial isopeptide formation D2 family protein [Rarobacter incanus]
MIQNTYRSGRALRVAGALGVASLLVGAVAVAGSAQAADYGNIDGTETGSIIIHKHKTQTGTVVSDKPDGSTSAITSDPVAGVTFTAYKIAGVDLTTNSGWDLVASTGVVGGASNADLAAACAAPTTSNIGGTSHTLGSGIPAESATNAQGKATISDGTTGVTVGAYLVCETDAPANVIDKAQPFIVTIPYSYKVATPASETWLYDVNVYPKNGLLNPVEKTPVTQPATALGLGSTATYTVKTSVPTIPSDAYFDYYEIVDAPPTGLTNLAVTSVVADATTLTSGTDYTVMSGSPNAGDLKLAFTATGLGKLKNTYAEKDITVTITGTVSGTGSLTNTAKVYSSTITSATTPTTPGTPDYNTPNSSDDATTNWGNLTIKKEDAGQTSAGLKDAVFEVYAADTPYATNCSTVSYSGTKLTVSGNSTFTSLSDGTITIPGLFVSSDVDGSNATSRCYVLKEVTAPAGYVLPAGGSEYTPVAVTTGTSAGIDIEITNTRKTSPNLPLTGAAGQVLMTAIGAGLFAIAIGFVFVRRSRKVRAN